jgi:GNAT superfamily N-acetyltransferase
LNNEIVVDEKAIVHPDFQNKGIGTELMKEIERKFSKVSRYELFTGFKDEKNIYFYKKLGYKVFKEESLSNDLKLIFLEKIN